MSEIAVDRPMMMMENRSEEDDGGNSTYDDSPPRAIYEYLGFGCSLSMIVISIVGAVGNGYAIWHFGRPSSRSSVNVLLTALSAFDLILLCAGAPMYSLLGIYSYDRRDTTLAALAHCMTILYPFSNAAQAGSVYTMCLISFERYLGVCHPFVARRELTVRRARIAVIWTATVAILYNLCRFWEYGIDEAGFPSAWLRTDPIYLTVYVHWLYFVFLFSIPFVTIFVFNVLVVAGVRKAAVNRPRCQHQMSAQQRGEAKTTTMLLVVVGVFFACNSLAWLLNGYEVLGYQPTDPAFEFVSDLNNLLVLAHPAFNIFVYARFSTKFRRDFTYRLCKHVRPSLVTKPSSSPRQSYLTGTKKNYAVLNAVVVGGGDPAPTILEAGTVDNGTDHHQQETCMSISTTTTATVLTPSGCAVELGDLRSSSMTRELMEDNKRQLLRVLGLAESGSVSVETTAVLLNGIGNKDEEEEEEEDSNKLVFV